MASRTKMKTGPLPRCQSWNKADVNDKDAPEYRIDWLITNACNFKCEYCFGSRNLRKKQQDCGKYSPEHISKCFDNTGRNWHISITGGEPFLYPDFVKLAVALTKNHYISINTNLSTSNVYEFADTVPPEKVLYIPASLHIMEREKRKNGVNEYLEKFRYLQERGFRISLEYVSYPPLFPRLANDYKYFTSRGVKIFDVKIFKGIYNGKEYPQSYTDEEISLISKYIQDPRERYIMQNRLNPFGRPCAAGQKLFRLDGAGNLTRCATVNRNYGNLFTEEYHFDDVPRPCPAKICTCPFLGMIFIEDANSPILSIMKEIMTPENLSTVLRSRASPLLQRYPRLYQLAKKVYRV